MPLQSDLLAASDLQRIRSSGTTVANHGSRSDIVDGVVAIRGGANSGMLSLVLAIQHEALESGVAGDELASGQGVESRGPHVVEVVEEYIQE